MGMVLYLRRASPSNIARLTSDPVDWQDFAFGNELDDGHLIDFDKAWHALHFMLAEGAYNTDHPLDMIVRNDEMFGLDENGFGGFSVVSPEEIAAFDQALKALSDEELANRYNPEAMDADNVYMADLFAEEGSEALPYVMQGVPALRRFTSSCAVAGDGALRILS